MLLKEKMAGKVDEKVRRRKGTSSYWMTLKKREDAGN
jgi:hypothetical protein